MFVLDTNTVAYFFRGEGRVAARLLATPPREVAIAAIVAYELRFGIARLLQATRRSEQLEQLLSWITILPFDDAAARRAAALRADLERLGQPIGPHDTLIAGTVLAVGATLVTRNLAEFSRVPGLELEDWYG
ncbi:MAG: PIN domain-containing protein [Steroidobacteraceae bacterium]|jgi:tRNA(fMet)-specific endonuclease VapC|nr:PIN domain-containing protein [Steroidobacteraceae bacterium]